MRGKATEPARQACGVSGSVCGGSGGWCASGGVPGRMPGETIQSDGSPYDRDEGRAPRCTVIVFLDAATERLMVLRSVPAVRRAPAPKGRAALSPHQKGRSSRSI
jgi:hypothetical protein